VDDPLDYYYRPGTSVLYRARLRDARLLLGDRRYRSLLDIGYGSGIFMPELARIAERVVGVDVHNHRQEVARSLEAIGLDVELKTASLYELPFSAGAFDAVVCISVLEHLVDLEGAFGAFARVLGTGGILVCGFPVRNVVTDSFFRIAGYEPRTLHPSGHAQILAAARSSAAFTLERVLRFPRMLPLAGAAYVSCRLRRI
jgi:ubiquinone/menaquinone biosynthesis C-methylase UbiE